MELMAPEGANKTGRRLAELSKCTVLTPTGRIRGGHSCEIPCRACRAFVRGHCCRRQAVYWIRSVGARFKALLFLHHPPLIPHGPCQHSTRHMNRTTVSTVAQNKKPVFSLGKPYFDQPRLRMRCAVLQTNQPPLSCLQPPNHPCGHAQVVVSQGDKEKIAGTPASWRLPSHTSPHFSRAIVLPDYTASSIANASPLSCHLDCNLDVM
jgi:hypothetical protein